MGNMLRKFYDFVAHRLMGFGGDVPITEDVQKTILRLVEDHGRIDAEKIIDLLYSNHAKDRMLREVLQAAQILVNHGQLQAFQNETPIDPVYGNELTEFSLKL